MTVESSMNVSELDYGEIKADGESTMVIKDYDGVVRIITAKRNEVSNFVVYKASTVWSIYGHGFIICILCISTVGVCIIIAYSVLSRLIRWQDRVNLRMKEAADAATAAGQAKGRFLAQMSHEIRTPINAVLGMNEMILRESKDKDILDYSENIRTAGKTLLSLINSILDFSKIDDGKMEIIPVEYDTVSFVNNLVNSVSQRAEAKGLEFIVKTDSELPCMLIGDDVRLTQVIVNLLTNAVKYTERGSVTLSVSCGERTESGIVLAVSVKDTGIGIRDEDMDKLFESFSRLDETRNRNIEGTGLGMAIVTKLLTLMYIRLNVDSVYGSGSVFSFEIKHGIAD
ncbi:MAG: histidine kinase, partial [Ruminiclostridium sp.]|nr:histidine kinase [Ruminiclostridium sp.]